MVCVRNITSAPETASETVYLCNKSLWVSYGTVVDFLIVFLALLSLHYMALMFYVRVPSCFIYVVFNRFVCGVRVLGNLPLSGTREDPS